MAMILNIFKLEAREKSEKTQKRWLKNVKNGGKKNIFILFVFLVDLCSSIETTVFSCFLSG